MPKSRKPKYRFYAFENQNKEIVVSTKLLSDKIDLFADDIAVQQMPDFLWDDEGLLNRHYKECEDEDGETWIELSYALYVRIFHNFINTLTDLDKKHAFFDVRDDFYLCREHVFKKKGYRPLIRERLT
jgi:hypothetical protein